MVLRGLLQTRIWLCLGPAAMLCSGQVTAPANYQPITGGGRIEWATMTTISLPSFGAGLANSAWGTGFDHPSEYGTSLKGFGKRFGLRLTGVATSNVMEAGLGRVLGGEDPRYERAGGESFGYRVGHVVKMTFIARNGSGDLAPAYARYAAISGSNFLSNAWRPDSDATAKQATIRIGLGFLGRMSANAFYEFWPDVKDRYWKH